MNKKNEEPDCLSRLPGPHEIECELVELSKRRAALKALLKLSIEAHRHTVFPYMSAYRAPDRTEGGHR
jgi:hypothetical protein